MKILLINNFFCKSGGTENSLYRTAQILRENGHEVFFFATDKQPFIESEYEYANYFSTYHRFYSLDFFKKSLLFLNYFYNKEAKKKLDEYLKAIKPDIVHVNNIMPYLTTSVLDACKENHIPVVMTLRDAAFACPGSLLTLPDSSYCKNHLCVKYNNPVFCVKNKCYEGSLIKSLNAVITHLFNKKFHKKVDKIICASNVMAQLALECHIPESKITVINNFIDEFFFQQCPNYQNNGYFLYVGRLNKEKGVNVLIDAFSKLPKEIKLRIVGDGKEKETLVRQAEALNLSNIEFIAPKYSQDLIDEYKNCIASILPSVCLEAFGLSVIESFSLGKPVIGSNLGGIPEIIDHNENGLLFKSGNVQELASAILNLYSNPDSVVKMGQNARKKVEDCYSAQMHYQKLINVYNDLSSRILTEAVCGPS